MRKLLLVPLFGLAALVIASFAFADSRTINFETYTVGNINGQDSWSALGSAGLAPCGAEDNAFDEGVVNNTYGFAAFGTKSFRISNAKASGCFADQAISPKIVDEAGEPDAVNGVLGGTPHGVRQPHFESQFDIASTLSTQQPGLVISVSPQSGQGGRMSFLRFDDMTDGIHVHFYDYQDVAPFGSFASPADGCGAGDDFVNLDVATISRAAPHTIKLTMDFLPDPHNDIVSLYVDGALVHTGTSWEDYYRWCTENGGGQADPTKDVSRTVDSLIFMARSNVPLCNPSCAGKGYLFDNINMMSGPSTLPTISVTKELYSLGVGTNDKFNLLIDGQVEAGAVGNGGTAGPVHVAPGPHVVSETALAPASLGNYRSSVICIAWTASSAVPLRLAGFSLFSPSANVTVNDGETVACFVFNLQAPNVFSPN